MGDNGAPRMEQGPGNGATGAVLQAWNGFPHPHYPVAGARQRATAQPGDVTRTPGGVWSSWVWGGCWPTCWQRD